jgi:glutamyl endopeptidase
MNALPPSAHASVSSLRHVHPRRFYSSAPFLGADNRRHPVNPDGSEAVPGFKPSGKKKRAKPQHRNVTELTYGLRKGEKLQIGAASVAGQQTLVSDPTLYPWRTNAELRISVPGKSDIFIGTGWFIGPYTLITAAHAVYPREVGVYTGWASDIEVIPASNGGNPAPYGSYHSNRFFCPTGWQTDGDVGLDYAAILLTQGLGNQVGTLGYATYSDEDLLQSLANLAGYPVDPPDGQSPRGTLWYGAGAVSHVDDSFVYYSLDTRPGQSGSSVYRNIGDRSYSVAIHIAAGGDTDRGLRIIEPVYQNLQNWANMSP